MSDKDPLIPPCPWSWKWMTIGSIRQIFLLAGSGVHLASLYHARSRKLDPVMENAADLMAAAPDLFSACKMAAELIAAEHASAAEYSPAGNALRVCRAALAKATASQTEYERRK